jgi:trehalose 6-phosphate phosphatase
MGDGGAADVRRVATVVAGLPRPLLVAFDVDGTLAPIVDDPAAARVPVATRRLLERIASGPDVHVALVTGRDGASVDAVSGGLATWRAVSHGRVVLAPDQAAEAARLAPEDEARLTAFRRWAEREAVPQGGRIEDKDGAVAVHARVLAQRDPARAEALLDDARTRAEAEGLHVRMGRAVCEAEVEAGDKGTALARLLEATGAQGVFYAGDDLTDVPALALAVDSGGVGVFVRSSEREPPARVSATLDGTDAVVDLLGELARHLAP